MGLPRNQWDELLALRDQGKLYAPTEEQQELFHRTYYLPRWTNAHTYYFSEEGCTLDKEGNSSFK